MKTYRERKNEKALKEVKKVWKFLKVESAVRLFGVQAVRHAMGKWVEYQRKNSSLLKKKAELENALAEINNKI